MRDAVVALASLVSLSSAQVFNVVDFGAVGDGKADDTRAVNWAFENASHAVYSTVLFPAKNSRGDPAQFVTGPFNMSSNQLVLVAGTVLGSTNNADYRLVDPLPYYAGGQDPMRRGQGNLNGRVSSTPWASQTSRYQVAA